MKSERFRRLAKESLWVGSGQALAVLGALASVRLLTELLGPTEYGELALGMTVALLINQVLLGPLGQGATRFYAPATEAGELARYIGSLGRLALIATSCMAAVSVLIVIGLLVGGLGKWVSIVAAALVFGTLNGHHITLNGIQNAARRRRIVAMHQAADAWGRFLAAAAMVSWLGATSTVAMCGYIAASVLVLGSQFFFFYRSHRAQMNEARGDRDWVDKIVRYCWPFGTWGIFYWGQRASDRWALVLFESTDEVGRYTVLFQLGFYPILLATDLGVKLLAPILFQKAGDASDGSRIEDVRVLSVRFTRMTLAMTLAAFAIAWLLHEQILFLFAADEFRSVSPLLPWMVLAGGLFAAGQTIALYLMSHMKTQTMIMAKITTALIGIVLNFAGAYCYGILGVVIAVLIFAVVYLLWMVALVNRVHI